jgi:hypothetical protein
MTPLWQENFDFYEAAADDGRAFVSLDLAAAQHAPVASHPVRLQFRVKMLQPREDGLRSDAESEALFALEDALVEVVREKHGGVYVARAVAFGYSEFYFYVPSARRDGSATGKAIGERFKPYTLEWLEEEDADWERYFELYPNAYAMQTMRNRALIRQMLAANDRLEVPRIIDHLAFFPSRLQAEAAVKELTAADFQVDPLQAPADGQTEWAVQFHREDACDGETPDEFCFEILDILEPLEGEYDGWGSTVQALPKAQA